MKKILSLFPVLLFYANTSAQRTTATDGDWSKQFLVLRNSAEADLVIRVGDIDNLGFGFEEGFNPFSGRSGGSHDYPWNANPADARGTDRIMVPTSYQYGSWGGDGYVSGTSRPGNNPQPITIPLGELRTIRVDSAALQIFIDDFQAPSMGSKFQVKINGLRFTEAEKLINRIDQTGPVGKLITIRLTPELLQKLSADSLLISIDDPTSKVGDGFALDFVKLLINPKLHYKGRITGKIIDADTREPIPGANAFVEGAGRSIADATGNFVLENIPAGLTILSGSHPGYSSTQKQVDVISEETGEPLELELRRSGKVTFNNKTLQEGENLVLNNIQFDVNSAILKPAGKTELDKLAATMKENISIEILLSGHTSAEGSPVLNRELSLKRVRACKDYLVGKGIDDGRISIRGHGPDMPVAPNDTEANRAKNRRVELKLTKL